MKYVLFVAMMVLVVPAWSADATETPASLTQDQLIEQIRNDLQAKRADIMAKGLTLTAEQAAKFWPLFEAFQKEQGEIVENQIKATQKYAKNYANLSDAESLEYVNMLLARDVAMHDLRVKWLAKFQTVVPPKVAARAIQLDRRLGQVTQVQISSQMPLIR